MLNNRNRNIDQNNSDYDFCHNRAALLEECQSFSGNTKLLQKIAKSFFFLCPLKFSVITQCAQ